jgi:hypothetical protein
MLQTKTTCLDAKAQEYVTRIIDAYFRSIQNPIQSVQATYGNRQGEHYKRNGLCYQSMVKLRMGKYLSPISIMIFFEKRGIEYDKTSWNEFGIIKLLENGI